MTKIVSFEGYKTLATEYLEICDQECKGDLSVGLWPCRFWNGDSNQCELKTIVATD